MKIKLSELKSMIREVLDEEAENIQAEVEETLEPVSAADGNPLKSVKAKKAERILAKERKEEAYIRKLVREELKFVMFNDVEDGVSRKRAKKRIAQKGSSKTNSTI